MDVYEAVESRRAVRGFTDEPVSREVIERVLTAAAWSPSGSNIQPWNIYVVTGAPLAELKKRAVERVATGVPWDEREYEMYPPAMKSPYSDRRSAFGKERYSALGIARDDETVEPERDLAAGPCWIAGSAGGAGVVAHLDDLLSDAVEILSVGEVPVGVVAAVAPGRRRVPALEDLRIRPLGRVERLGLEGEVVDAVEVAAEIDVVLGPDLAQNLQELGAAAVPLVVFEPGLAEVGELGLEPARDDVDGEPPGPDRFPVQPDR